MGAILSLLKTLSARRQRQILMLLSALLLATVAEVAKIGAVLPVVALAARPGTGASHLTSFVRAAGGANPLLLASALLILFALLSVATRLVLVWLTHRFVVGVGEDISERIFARLLRQPYEAYKTRSSGEILAGFEKVRGLLFYVLLPAMQAVTAAVVSVAIIVMLLAIDPVVASIVASAIGGIFLAAHFATRRMLDENSRTVATMATAKMNVVQQALGNIRDILIDRSQPVFERDFREIDSRLRWAQSVNMLVAAGPRAFIESAAVVALVGAALLATGRPGGLVGALPALGALAVGAQRLIPLLQQVYAGWAMAAGNVHSVADVIAFMNLPTSPDADMPEGGAVPWGDIVLSDVSFGFGGASPVLRGIDLRIPRGARVGIAGESGSGKSTLVDILMGLLTPTSGTISIGGTPMDEALRRRWQAQVAHVPQAVYLSDGSIANNIAFGLPPEAIDFDRIAAAAEAAQAAGFIARLPHGYETRVGEGGARLSGGERQRIGIARALYKRADILILDEATSALAEDMEAALLAALDRESMTLILVSHRRSSLRNCDLIVRMADGRAHASF
ncbi:ATP-binding cassette domain-containing protein [Sphingomonas sp.]|uniref:ABC transporter ATP-binding protein n=1 Tax=Sphingomonas sp. TaxID=28214 RepID=UPI001B1350C0|nr:ATP-binding cassette domain-containing protein [Sphingomonas sp.]MBO9714788.1 ATP-binding cassette domain-containing protein [Sphingomonas sp.]